MLTVALVPRKGVETWHTKNPASIMTTQVTSPEISTSTGTATSRSLKSQASTTITLGTSLEISTNMVTATSPRLKSQASTTIIPGTSLEISTKMVTAINQRSLDTCEHTKASFGALFACLAAR
ncbi:hypothetical protein [Bosea massiliensis]|uniref:Uncharacterized protein n=1 Tax=Bosea massiliensis TaxID=151419 RepID=A0ABW0P4M7_9HYPH